MKVDSVKSALKNTQLLSSHSYAIMVVLLISGAQATHFLGFTTSLEGVHEFSTFSIPYFVYTSYTGIRKENTRERRKRTKDEETSELLQLAQI